MGKLNFRGYLILRFYPTREIRENLMHSKNMCFTVCKRRHSLDTIHALALHLKLSLLNVCATQTGPLKDVGTTGQSSTQDQDLDTENLRPTTQSASLSSLFFSFHKLLVLMR